MADDHLRVGDCTAGFVSRGWRELDAEYNNLALFQAILKEMTGEDPANEIIDLVRETGYTPYSPGSKTAFDNVLGAHIGGIVHYLQTGAGSAVVPCNEEIFPVSNTVDDPTLYGSLTLILNHPIPYSEFNLAARGVRRPVGWVDYSWQLTEAAPAPDDDDINMDQGPRWVPANTEADGFAPTANSAAIQAIMISVIPAVYEKQALFQINANPRMAHFLEPKERPGLGLHPAFPGIIIPRESKPIVISCTTSQLYQLLEGTEIPHITKFYSAYANVFKFTAKAVCKYADNRDFEYAKSKWHIQDPDVIQPKDYQIAIATYILGCCYTIRENAPSQIAKRLSACKAALGEEAITESDVADFMTKCQFKVGLPNGIAAEIVGVAVAVLSTNSSDSTASRSALLPVPEVARAFHLDEFSSALYTQLRLVAEFLQSTTIRFALAGLTPLQYVWQFTPDFLQAEANELRKLKNELVNCPYTGCVDPIPAPFTIANCPHLCYYGVEVFRRALSPDQLENFKKYRVDGIIEKMVPNNKRLVEALLLDTPNEDSVMSAEYIKKLPLEIAENRFKQLPVERREVVRGLILKSNDPSSIKTYLLEEERTMNLEKVNTLLISRIEFCQKLKAHEYNDLLEEATDPDDIRALKHARRTTMDKFTALRAMCEKQDEAWKRDAPQDAIEMHKTHYENVLAALERVRAGGSVEG